MLTRTFVRLLRTSVARMADENVVKQKLIEHLKPSFLTVNDMSDGCGAKYQVTVVSSAFEGKPLLACHRLVNDALKEEMTTIHALSIKTFTPQKWETVQQQEKEAEEKMLGCVK